MSESEADEKPAEKPPRVPLPAGYRQGIISAITVLLGFSLLFLRYWSFEASGEWTVVSFVAAVLLHVSLLPRIFALFGPPPPHHYLGPVSSVPLASSPP